MSKRHKTPPVNFKDFLDNERAEATIPLVLGDRTFHVVMPTGLTDAEYEELQACGDHDVVAQARVLLVEPYEEFAAAGGSGMGIQQLINKKAAGTLESGEGGASSGS